MKLIKYNETAVTWVKAKMRQVGQCGDNDVSGAA